MLFMFSRQHFKLLKKNKLTLHFQKKYKQHTFNGTINSNDLDDKLFLKIVYVKKVLSNRCAQKAGGERVGQFAKQNQIRIIHKRLLGNFSPTNLECKPRGLTIEINVYEAVKQEICVLFFDMKCLKCSNV